MGISLGRYKFINPKKITDFTAPKFAGVYAIMIPDLNVKPAPFRVIYFGESEDLSERGFLKSHHKYECWLREAGEEDILFISIYPMPKSKVEDRKSVENELIQAYRTNEICND